MTVRLVGTFRVALAGIVVAFLLWQGSYAVRILWWKNHNPEYSRFMAYRLEERRRTDPRFTLRHTWQPYDQISRHLKQAVVAAEDDHFIDHEGFDWEGIQDALEKNRQRGRVVAGGSTLSQQLAKNLFLSADKTPGRKIQEAFITVWLEALWDKRRILEVYLNVAEWGDGVFGAEAAARRYFNLSAARLNADQAARLAVMLPAPRRLEKNPYSDFMNRRTEKILARMSRSEIP